MAMIAAARQLRDKKMLLFLKFRYSEKATKPQLTDESVFRFQRLQNYKKDQYHCMDIKGNSSRLKSSTTDNSSLLVSPEDYIENML